MAKKNARDSRIWLSIQKEKKEKRKYVLISCASLLTFLLIWELCTDILKLAPSYAMPSPLKVFRSFVAKLYQTAPDGSTLPVHIGVSVYTALLGFLMGAVIGSPLGILMAWFKTLDRIVKPVFDVLRPIPPIAWIPIMLVVLGIGTASKVAVIFMASFVPCVINAYSGIKQTNEVHIWVGKTFGASRSQLLFRVAIPTAMPMIFTGIKVSLGASWMALVAAELLASSSGLGYMIQIARSVGRADIIIVGMLMIGVISMLFSAALEYLERRFVKGVK
ncbi:ABC transporter permease [Christensenellaceae bacterium NSJ-63]|uniref:ABC transporter permease n=1 Tax=Guopingia tenuis TaxID=2763656 RepID=A0A926HWQ1_9FIRM|nr:ABC transporter permease [Guopingia tenuis]MBC8539224.1 ABC transporter permease [Guopingia tenuis]